MSKKKIVCLIKYMDKADCSILVSIIVVSLIGIDIDHFGETFRLSGSQ